MMSAAWPSFTAAWYSPSAATIFVNYVDGYKTFSELDRLVLGSLADLASLAVSEKAGALRPH